MKGFVLEVGRTRSHGTERGVQPVLRDGVVVAQLRSSSWRQQATAVVEGQEWALGRRRGELTGRWVAEPEHVVRLSARQVSVWKSTWAVDLDGTPVEVQNVSPWKGKRQYLVAGRVVAESGTTGGWSPRPTLVVDDSLEAHHQVFLLWVERVISGRNEDSASGSFDGGAGGGD